VTRLFVAGLLLGCFAEAMYWLVRLSPALT
jgi:hypothetical protein